MIEKAYGKVNISLDIVGIREDGYHLLDMIMVPVNIYDTLEMVKAEETTFTSNTDLPYDSGNLIYKAVELMKKEFSISSNYRIKLIKRIPQQAGMAGGSADAAAVLRLINRLEKLNLSNQQLADLGVRLGADVPFCVYQKPARVQGIGEKIRLLDLKQTYGIVIVKPFEGVSTREAFRLADSSECVHPDMDEVERRFLNHDDPQSVMGNSLEASAISLVEQISEVKQEMKKAGFASPLMTGSGSAVFALLDGAEKVRKLPENWKKRFDFSAITSIINL